MADARFFRTGPAEIIIHIVGCCESTRDVLALVTTGRHVNDVWRANAAAALWPVLLRELPHMKSALIAVSLPLSPLGRA